MKYIELNRWVVVMHGWAGVVHVFNPSTRKIETMGSL